MGVPHFWRESLAYDPETGAITHKVSGKNMVRMFNDRPYVIFSPANRRITAAQVAWFLQTGETIPRITCLDGDRKNLRWSNLTNATAAAHGSVLEREKKHFLEVQARKAERLTQRLARQAEQAEQAKARLAEQAKITRLASEASSMFELITRLLNHEADLPFDIAEEARALVARVNA